MPTTPYGRERLDLIVSTLDVDRISEAAYEIGKLVGLDHVTEDDAIGALHVASSEKRLPQSFFAEVLESFNSGQDAARRSAANSRYVLVPGEHPKGSEIVKQSNDSFVEDAIRRLPPGSLYRMGRLVGQLTGNLGSQQFMPLTVDGARILIDTHMRLGQWTTTKKNGDRLRFQPASKDHASLLLEAASTHYVVRDIQVFANYPIYAPFGLCLPGFQDGYYYDQPGELDPLDISSPPGDPRTILTDLTIDFPFNSEADRENFFGLLLTPILRNRLGGNVPMHVIMASKERTGKTKLVGDILGGIVLGKQTPAMQLVSDDRELDKRILSLLIEGTSVIHFDNLKDLVDSPSLASLLTAETYSGRILQNSKMATCKNNLTVVATGNSVRATGEIVKRSVPIVLQPKDASPELREDFRHQDLKAFITQNRVTVLRTLLWMIDSWIAAGSPPSRTRMGGFEEWAASVGGVLNFHGFNLWMSNYRSWVKKSDPYGEDLRAFVSSWLARYGTDKVPARDLMELAKADDLFGVLFIKSERADLTSFSRGVLSKNLDSPIENVIIRCFRFGSNTRWYLERTDNVSNDTLFEADSRSDRKNGQIDQNDGISKNSSVSSNHEPF